MVKQHVMNSFKLQGSRDGQHWTTIIDVNNDDSLVKTGSGRWLTPLELQPKSSGHAYNSGLVFRFIRIVLTKPTNTKSKRLTFKNLRMSGVIFLHAKSGHAGGVPNLTPSGGILFSGQRTSLAWRRQCSLQM